MKILYIGPLKKRGTCESRRQALVDIGNEVIGIDYMPFFDRFPLLLKRIQWKVRAGPAISQYNRELMYVAKDTRPDVLWVDKGIFVWASTLRDMKVQTDAFLVHHCTDDVFHNKNNSSRHYFRSIDIYDIHFTTNRPNVEELFRAGAKRVMSIVRGYDPRIFHPVPVSREDKQYFGGDVGFIGHWEPDREETFIKLLNMNKDINLKIWGDGWKKLKNPTLLRDCVQYRGAWLTEFAKVVNSTKINLNILSKWNRDVVTGKSVEIPACGGFMLAERTNEHLELFEEGKEAEFFEDFDELVKKIHYYLDHEEERKAIADRGRQRCLNSGYSNQDRMKKIMEIIKQSRK